MSKPAKDLANLDFLRSIAVLLVAGSHTLVYTGHANIVRWAGITGVAMFFVHTSLVLMWSLERDPHVARFYIRRIFRIYPLWLAVLFLTLAVRLPMAPFYYPNFGFFAPHWKELIYNILLMFNLTTGARVVGASWTLPIEMQMYLFLPLLFVFASRFRTVWTLLVLDLFIILYIHTRFSVLSGTLPICIPYFIPGIIAYVLMKRTSLQRLPSWSFIPWLFFIVSIADFFGNFKNMAFFCLALGLSLPLFRQISWPFLKRASSIVARYSYGIYLCHIGAIGLSVYILRDEPMFLRVAAYIAVFCGMPVLLYHLIEKPMIRVGARLAGHIESGKEPPMDQNALRLEPAP